uniref:Retrotransposon protein n=1 Tax=Globodera pallida TaxID=36090 RepID=A0A183CCH2_GLOPA
MEGSNYLGRPKWLITPRGDDLPKMLRCDLYWEGTEGLKESFQRHLALVCCPIAREEDKWTNWEKEAIQWKDQWNIFINFQDCDDIGDGMIGAAKGGSSEEPNE